MTDFEELKPYIGLESGAIRFQAVKREEIEAAEKELGLSLPSSLKGLYGSIGYGWIGSKDRNDLRNLFVHPLDIVDLYNGESEFSPPEKFLEGDLPIFDCGGDRFLVVRPESSTPEKIYVSLRQLCVNHPTHL